MPDNKSHGHLHFLAGLQNLLFKTEAFGFVKKLGRGTRYN